MNYIERLQAAIKKMHGASSRHLESVPIKETFQGKTVWEGVVEVFELTGHPKSNRCYAWSAQKDGTEQFTAVLHVPPIDTPLKAVQASIVAQQRRSN
jgi:hypothetical protein